MYQELINKICCLIYVFQNNKEKKNRIFKKSQRVTRSKVSIKDKVDDKDNVNEAEDDVNETDKDEDEKERSSENGDESRPITRSRFKDEVILTFFLNVKQFYNTF